VRPARGPADGTAAVLRPHRATCWPARSGTSLLQPEHDADRARLAKRLRAAGWRLQLDDTGVRVAAPAEAAPDLHRAAVAEGLALRSLVPVQESLEDVFLVLTGDDADLAVARAEQVAA
jgi:hypothetical protein